MSYLPIFLFLVATALVALVVLCLRFIYDYRINDRAIEVLLFRLIPLYRLPFDNIESIKKISLREAGLGGFTIRLGNRIMGARLLITKKRGLFKKIIITPDKIDEFINELERS